MFFFWGGVTQKMLSQLKVNSELDWMYTVHVFVSNVIT